MSFNSDSEEMDDASFGHAFVQSPPRTGGRSRPSKGRETPKSRRLFGGDDDSVRLSPARRLTLKPLDLNNDLHKETDEEVNSAPLGGRKRSSSERRGEQDPQGSRTPIGRKTENGGDNMDAIYTSPYISPNSFITMDGRFVQSKNPFSSPMMTDDDQQQQFLVTTATKGSVAPSIPLSFSGESKMPSILPPRQSLHKRESLGATPGMNRCALYGGRATMAHRIGYPDKRYSFTGSPIQETEDMETDTASCGSLHKVRRLKQSDDVVAASGQHLTNRRKELAIDTTRKMQSRSLMEEEISPTEVASFPPPTPVKARPSPNPYSAVRRHEPTTPFLNRRQPPAKTPHPRPLLHRSNEQEEDIERPKSRFYGDFDIIGELGKGSFGTVYKVLSRLDGCMYAIKAALRKAKGVGDRDRMLKEVYALAALSDQADTATFHIVRYHQAWMEDDRLYIQTELCSGTLAIEIAKQGTLTDERRYKVLREILLALEFIHRNNMVHLDIKPDNIFLKNDQYKLGDFGLVSKASCSEDVEEGDSRYMSLELLSNRPSDLTKSDIFSLGATMYEICLGRQLPMNGQEWQEIRSGRLLPMPNTPFDLVALIRQMMNPVAFSRPAASELLKRHQLLSDEQKALNAAKTKVVKANMELAAQAHKFKLLSPLPKRGLARSNTWSGGPLPYL